MCAFLFHLIFTHEQSLLLHIQCSNNILMNNHNKRATTATFEKRDNTQIQYKRASSTDACSSLPLKRFTLNCEWEHTDHMNDYFVYVLLLGIRHIRQSVVLVLFSPLYFSHTFLVRLLVDCFYPCKTEFFVFKRKSAYPALSSCYFLVHVRSSPAIYAYACVHFAYVCVQDSVISIHFSSIICPVHTLFCLFL